MKIAMPFSSLGGKEKPDTDKESAVVVPFPNKPGPRLDDARRPVKTGLVAAGAFIGLLGLFAVVAPLSEAAVTEGEVVTSGDRLLIQPETAGVVSQFLVGEGQRVRAGQPLIRLNGVRSGAAAEQAQANRDALRAAQARLIAERDGAEAIMFPTDLMSRGGEPVVASAIASQRALFERHRGVMLADRRIVAEQASAAQAKQAATSRQLELIRDELGGIRELYSRGYARKTQLLALERAEAQLQADASVTTGEVSKAGLESARLADDQMMKSVSELARVEQELAQVDPALRVRQYDAARDLLRSPVNGRVSGVTRVGQGAVLRAGQTVMEVVPDSRTLIVETRIRPADIDDVKVGLPATLRFTTVNPHGRSDFEGKVIALSPAPVAEGDAGRAFRAQIAVTDLRGLRKAGVQLSPGYPVSVQIRAKDRTLFEYLMSPISDALGRMFREE